MRIKLYILSLLLLSGLLFAENTLSFGDNGDGTWNINYSSDSDIAGFQFVVDGADVTDVSGGDAEAAGLFLSTDNNIVLAFSFTGATIPAGAGVLLILSS
ncbi:uncharacterized protein METZ01_LOCUS279856, partial [marine metagenome]